MRKICILCGTPAMKSHYDLPLHKTCAEDVLFYIMAYGRRERSHNVSDDHLYLCEVVDRLMDAYPAEVDTLFGFNETDEEKKKTPEWCCVDIFKFRTEYAR